MELENLWIDGVFHQKVVYELTTWCTEPIFPRILNFESSEKAARCLFKIDNNGTWLLENSILR